MTRPIKSRPALGFAGRDFGANMATNIALLKHIIPDINNIPQAIIDVRELQLGLWQPPRRREPLVRARDDNQWIKKDNRYTGGIRKNRMQASPFRNKMPQQLSFDQHERHFVYIMGNLLSIRSTASPFTLVLDDLNQRAVPLRDELIRRALSRNINVVYVAFESKRGHPAIRLIAPDSSHTGDWILTQVENALRGYKDSLVIIDSIYDLVTEKGVDTLTLFNLVAGKYGSTLVGIYHQDMLPASNVNPYAPGHLDIMNMYATTVVICKSFAHALAAEVARDRSLPKPTHGILQGAEGVVQCLNANDTTGIVLEVEFRRKSGRPETESFFLRPSRRADYNEPIGTMVMGTLRKEFVTLLARNPAFATPEVVDLANAMIPKDKIETSFNLGLTKKQKEARDTVVLPYRDAQKKMGEAGEGGRILYDMGAEDDFDEEEDEI